MARAREEQKTDVWNRPNFLVGEGDAPCDCDFAKGTSRAPSTAILHSNSPLFNHPIFWAVKTIAFLYNSDNGSTHFYKFFWRGIILTLRPD